MTEEKIEQKAEEYADNEKHFDGQAQLYIIDGYLAGYHECQKEHEWHDLEKDPNDLPKDITSLYLVRVYSWDFGLSHLYKKYGMYIPTVCEWSGEYFKALNDMAYSNARNIKSCIAWKEIVPPKE